jgi:hypothetical protein
MRHADDKEPGCLRAALAGGERPASDVLREAADLGIPEVTLRRAREALGVQAPRQGFTDGRFLLALPSNGTDPADRERKPNGASNGNGLDHEKPVVLNGLSVS